MQRAVLQQAITNPIHSQASRLMPGHGTGIEHQASNDETYCDQDTSLRWVLSLVGNVIGGSILLSAMFVLPHVISRILS